MSAERPIPAESYAPLLAQANAADRANRPTIVVVGPLALLAVMVLLAVVSLVRFWGARADLTGQLDELAEVQRLCAEAESLRDRRVSADALYPPKPTFATLLAETAKDAWGVAEERDLPMVIPTSAEPRRFGVGQGAIERAQVEVPLRRPTELQDLFAWINAVETNEELRGVFLSRLELRPIAAGGWTGNVRFRMYQAEE